MLRTTYKTDRPEKEVTGDRPEDFSDAEYRQVFLRSTEPPDAPGFIVQVNHGWWNQKTKKAIHSLNQYTQTFATHDEADAAFDEQVNHLATVGFIHSFTPVPVPPDFVEYERLEKTHA